MPRVVLAKEPADLLPGDQVRALLFDWDGTLFDNHHFNYLVLAKALSEAGVTIDEPWFERNSGYAARDIVARAAEREGVRLDPLNVLRTRDALSETLVDEVIPAVHLHELLERFRGTLAFAVVTGSERSNIESTLVHFGLEKTFDAIVTRDQVRRGKPDPAGYQRALELLDVPAGRALAYEDSDQGVAAAVAAGIDVVDVRPLGSLLR